MKKGQTEANIFNSFNKVKRTIESVVHEKQIDACINMLKLYGKRHGLNGMNELGDMINKKAKEVVLDLPH